MFIVIWETGGGTGSGHQAVLSEERAETVRYEVALRRPWLQCRIERAGTYADQAVEPVRDDPPMRRPAEKGPTTRRRRRPSRR